MHHRESLPHREPLPPTGPASHPEPVRQQAAPPRIGEGVTTAGDQTALVEAHHHLLEPLVRSLARRYPRHVDRDDLRGAAAHGLVDAASRFDAADGVPFARYLTFRVRGAVLDEVRRRDFAPRSLRRQLRQIDEATARLHGVLNREPSTDEVARELGVPVGEVVRAQADELAVTVLAAELPASPDDEVPIVESLVEDDPGWLPTDAAEHAEARELLQRSVALLDERLRRIIEEHDLGARSLADLAVELGVSDARVSQLRGEAILALRAVFAQYYDEVPEVPDDAPGATHRRAVLEASRRSRRQQLEALP